jgi:sortase (surface protein transpeptidase)
VTKFSAPTRRPPADDAPAAVAALVIGLVLASAGGAGLFLASQTGHPAAAIPAPTAGPVPVGKTAAAPSAAARPAARPAARSAPGFAPIPLSRAAAAPPPVTRPVARPVSLIIPAIGVNTRLVHLGLTASGALQVPPSTAVAGWYTGSPRPGEPGGAVIAGHIDSYKGPGVFIYLQRLHVGERAYVRRADGTLAVFRITMVRSYLKTKFPTGAVYGPTPDAQLRLITCGGTFDWATGHYLSNTIVYASLVH